jgi:hypothetical protein
MQASNRVNKKTLFLVSLATALGLPAIVFAQTVTGIITNIMATVVRPVAIAVVVVFWVVTGILFLKAQGEPGAVTKAQHSLITALAGTVVVILAWSALNIVCNTLGVCF